METSCKVCGYGWNIRGFGPLRCANPKCRSALWMNGANFYHPRVLEVNRKFKVQWRFNDKTGFIDDQWAKRMTNAIRQWSIRRGYDLHIEADTYGITCTRIS